MPRSGHAEKLPHATHAPGWMVSALAFLAGAVLALAAMSETILRRLSAVEARLVTIQHLLEPR
jgi:hypothetical protein